MNKENKPVFKKWWFWVIIAVVILGAISFATQGGQNEIVNQEQPTAQNTADDQLTDLAIGSPVTINDVTVTVNSITDGEPALMGTAPTYEVNVTYKNNSNSIITISPYDWATVLHSGSDKAHVGGDTSFSSEILNAGEEWTGNVTLWADGEPEKVRYESSLDLSGDTKKATWLMNKEK
jgi:hypothetical protein